MAAADRQRGQAELKPLSDGELLARLEATVTALAAAEADRMERLRLEYGLAVGREELARRGLSRPKWRPAAARRSPSAQSPDLGR